MALTFERSTIEKIYGGRFIDGNSVTLLYKGRESFDVIFESLEAARRLICLQFYIFRNDETGTEVAEILKRKAREGIGVFILYDHFGSIGTPKAFWKSLSDSGINIQASRPFKWQSPFHYAHRDHRKLIIIDGIKAFTGGLNLANEYRGFHIRVKTREWRDTGIMIEGPAAGDLLKTFQKSWITWGSPPAGLLAGIRQGASVQRGSLPGITIFSSSSKGRRKMRGLLYYSINHSKKSIYLTTAYFIPSKRMIDALEDAVRRGVEVKLLLPGKSDVPAAYYAGRAFFTRLLKAGAGIYNYQGEVLHAKSYVFDGCWSIVGSANLDFQSLRWNDEGNVGILDNEFGKKMTEVFQEDLRRSVEIREEEWIRRPFFEKIKEGFFAVFRRRL